MWINIYNNMEIKIMKKIIIVLNQLKKKDLIYVMFVYLHKDKKMIYKDKNNI